MDRQQAGIAAFLRLG